MTIRNVSVDLNIIPEPKYIFDGSSNPNGYIEWSKLWIHNTDHQEKILFPIAYFKYNKIKIPENSNLDVECKKESEKLIKELKTFNGRSFPPHLDKSFRELLENGICKFYFTDKVKLTIKRLKSLLGNLTSSYDWPTSELGLKDRIYKEINHASSLELASIVRLLYTLKDHYPAILVRTFSNIYWLILSILMLGSFYFFRNKSEVSKIFLKTTTIYIFSKVFFILYLGTTFEPRLLTSLYPFIEVTIFLFLLSRKEINRNH